MNTVQSVVKSNAVHMNTQKDLYLEYKSFSIREIEFLATGARDPEKAKVVYESLLESENQGYRLDHVLNMIKEAAWGQISKYRFA